MTALGTGRTLGSVPVIRELPKEATEGPRLRWPRGLYRDLGGTCRPTARVAPHPAAKRHRPGREEFQALRGPGSLGVGLDTVALVAGAEDILSREGPPGARAAKRLGPVG